MKPQKKLKRERKRKITKIISVTITAATVAVFGFLAIKQSQHNQNVRQEINQIQLPDKEVFKQTMTTAEVANQKSILEEQLDGFKADTIEKGYKGYTKAKRFMKVIFFSSSNDLKADNANTHEELVNYYKHFTYTIDDISGEYRGQNIKLLVKMTVKQDGVNISDKGLYLFTLDNKGNIVGGTYYGK